MFSKPLVAAGLVASVNASVVISGVLTQGSGTLYATTSCFDCLKTTAGLWTYLKSTSSTWEWKQFTEVATGVKVEVTATGSKTEQGFCCLTNATENKSGDTANQICGVGYGSGTTLNANGLYGNIATPTSGNWNLLSQVAICPAYASVCGAPVKTGSTAVVGTNKRTAKLVAKGDSVVLQMATPIGTTGKNWAQESCSYVVKVMCGAPIVAIESTSDAELNTWALYFMEYTGLGATGITMRGDGTDSWFLPVATAVQVAGTAAAAADMPNDELAAVNFKVNKTSFLRGVPGQAVFAWLKSISDGYSTYTTTVTTYDAARKEWDDGKRGAKPYQPKQPDAVPTLLNQLKSTNTDKAAQASGFGAITQYSIAWGSVNTKAGHFFGTSAGRSTLDTVATALDLNAKSNYHWKSNTGKTATGTGTTLCDPAYVQVTGHLKKIDHTATKKMYVGVYHGEWATTLEDTVPTRPVATTAPKDSGAAYLSMGAAAALVALSLS